MNPYKKRSLLEVLKLHASSYMRIARIYEEYTSSIHMFQADPGAIPSDEQMKVVRGNLEVALKICRRMHLFVSARSMERILAEFDKKAPTFALTKQRFLEWYSCFESEVEGETYLLVLPHRVSMWSSIADRFEGEEIAQLVKSLEFFPDAMYDATEAGNCFAFERFTACVYHLMRCAEFGLISVAQAVNVPAEKIGKGWDGCITGIDSHVKLIASTKPSADWQDQVKKYSDLSAWFTTMQKGWRNPVSHVPRTYSEGAASAMFSATRILFEHLNAHGFQESSMPTAPVPLPGSVNPIP